MRPGLRSHTLSFQPYSVGQSRSQDQCQLKEWRNTLHLLIREATKNLCSFPINHSRNLHIHYFMKDQLSIKSSDSQIIIFPWPCLPSHCLISACELAECFLCFISPHDSLFKWVSCFQIKGWKPREVNDSLRVPQL